MSESDIQPERRRSRRPLIAELTHASYASLIHTQAPVDVQYGLGG
jgi:hypothetical protein